MAEQVKIEQVKARLVEVFSEFVETMFTSLLKEEGDVEVSRFCIDKYPQFPYSDFVNTLLLECCKNGENMNAIFIIDNFADLVVKENIIDYCKISLKHDHPEMEKLFRGEILNANQQLFVDKFLDDDVVECYYMSLNKTLSQDELGNTIDYICNVYPSRLSADDGKTLCDAFTKSDLFYELFAIGSLLEKN